MATLGWSPGRVRAAVDSRRWTRLRRSVFAETDVVTAAARTVRTRHRLDLAAAVAATTHAWAGFASAAVIHDLEFLTEPTLATLRLTRPASAQSRVRRRNGIELHECALPAVDRTSRDGVRVTSVARTVVDLARDLPLLDAVVLIDGAMRRLGLTGAAASDVLSRCSRWDGSVNARAALDLADPRAESVLESVSRFELVRAGLAPEPQCWLLGPEGVAVRVDFLWWDQRTVGESDGLAKYVKHGSSSYLDPLQLEKLRQERLEAWGLEVVRWTSREIHTEPAAVVARVRRGFARSAIRQEIRRRNGEVEIVRRLSAAPWEPA